MKNKITLIIEGGTVAQIKTIIAQFEADGATVQFSDPVDITKPGFETLVRVVETHVDGGFGGSRSVLTRQHKRQHNTHT